MPLNVSCENHGREGLSLTIRSLSNKAHDHLKKVCEAARKANNRVPSEKEMGVSVSFLEAMQDKRTVVPYAVKGADRHKDTYQYDEAEQTLLVSGRVFDDGRQVLMDAKLLLLAANIVSETLEIITDKTMANDVNWALSAADNTNDTVLLELVLCTLQNFSCRAHSVQLMKTVFEMLLRDQVKTVLTVRFEQTTADAIMAFVHGPMLNPKKAITKMYKSIRHVMENVLGVHNEKEHV